MDNKKIDKKSYDASTLNSIYSDEALPLHFKPSVDKTKTFTRTFKNAKLNPPTEGDRYWCWVEEINDLGKSYFQWNCYYNEIKNTWSDRHEELNVIWWTELAPRPF